MKLPFLKSLAASRDAAAEARQQIDVLREQIAHQKAELRRIREAPQSIDAALAAFDQWSERIADQGVAALHPEHLLQPDAAARGLRLPTTTVRVEGEFHTNHSYVDDVSAGIILAANLPALRGVIEAQLHGLVEGRECLSADQRVAQLAQAEGNLLALELSEEGAIRALEFAGIAIARRADAAPAAVLAADASLPV